MGWGGRVVGQQPLADGTIVKAVLELAGQEENLLTVSGWGAFEKGFGAKVRPSCAKMAQRPMPSGSPRRMWCSTRPGQNRSLRWLGARPKGSADRPIRDYAIYLDLEYDDGTPLWGQTANFSTGIHDWQRRQVLVLPDKPVKRLSFYLLFRGHGGKASFRDVHLHVIQPPKGAAVFDGLPVTRGPGAGGLPGPRRGRGSGFRGSRQAVPGTAAGHASNPKRLGVTFHDATLTDTTGKDRAVTLVYALPFAGSGCGG